MKYLFIFLLLSFSNQLVRAQNYLLMRPADCTNCLSAIYDLNQHFPNTEFKIIYPQSFKEYKKDIIEQIGLDKLENIKLFFSDDILSKYHNTLGSSLVILSNGVVQYNEEFSNIRSGDIRKALVQTMNIENSLRRVQLDKSKMPSKAIDYVLTDKYLSISDFFGKVYVMNIKSNRTQRISLDKSMQEELYNTLLRTDFDSKYPFIKATIKRMPIQRPKINNVRYNSKGDIYLQITVLNYFIKQDKGDTVFYHDNVVAQYNFNEGKIINLKSVDNKQLLPMYMMDVVPMDNGLAVHVENLKQPNNAILCLLKEEGNMLVLDKMTNVKKTKEFIKYKFNIGEPLLHHKGYVIGRYDNVLYNTNDGSSVKLKIADSFRKDLPYLEKTLDQKTNNRYSYYQNQALSLNRNGHPILYFTLDQQEFLYNILSNKLVRITEQINRKCSSDGKKPLGFYQDAHTLVWLDRNKKELVYLEHGLLD